ncbi:hypothetical protein ACFW2V_00580 [Streptomyces sp. NPDC058947]
MKRNGGPRLSICNSMTDRRKGPLGREVMSACRYRLVDNSEYGGFWYGS